MKKRISKTYFIWIFLFAISCTTEKKQQNKDIGFTIEVDSSIIKDFLKDPRNNLLLNELAFEAKCNPDTIKKSVLRGKFEREYYNCSYMDKGEKVAAMKSSVIKTDSTWSLGTNGFEIYHFETNKPSFPLKHDLKIGSSIQDFQKIFGSSKKLKNTYSYNFKFDLFSSKLVIESQENVVTKIIVTNKKHQ
ncbi:MAG: hypothetical protein AB8B65_19070 [Kordia sp.]|uniref:hypothetical protein n=1 Tax=Kordia sp. TaxID=1965332 RepID=UPI00385C72E7